MATEARKRPRSLQMRLAQMIKDMQTCEDDMTEDWKCGDAPEGAGYMTVVEEIAYWRQRLERELYQGGSRR